MSGKKDKGRQIIYRPGEVEFKVEDKKYDVSYVNLALGLNQIPTCEVGIAPANAEGEIRINTLELVPLKKAYLELTKKATELVKSKLKLEILPDDEKFPKQKIDLEDWLLVSCGMENVSTVECFSLTCVIAHPAFRLKLYSGCFFNGAGVLNYEDQVEGVTDPVDASIKAIEVMETANEEKIKTICQPLSTASTPLKDPNEIKEELQTGMGELKSRIPEVLKWDASYTNGSYGIPCEDLGDPVTYGVKYALLNAWTLQIGEQSYWGKLTGGEIVGDFFLEVIPNYNEKQLRVCPFNPYGGPLVKMPSYMVSVFNMPGFDPDPLYGVIMYQHLGTSEPAGSVTYQDMSQASAVIQPANMAFVPVQSKLSGGTLLHVQDLPWIDFAMTKAASKEDVDVRDEGGGTYDDSKAEPENIDPQIKESLYLWNQVRLRYLNNVFMSNYRNAMDAHLNCAFCLKTPEDKKDVIPGSILRFESDGELFRGKIETVVHNVDCETSRATTQINLKYCDVDKGVSNILGDPVIVPFYDAVQVEDYGDNGGETERS